MDPDDLSAAERATAVLAAADAVQYYKALASLARPSHGQLLQALPYSPALPFHDPTCVCVEPEPSGPETIGLYARAAYRSFDAVLMPAFASRMDLLGDLYQRLLLDDRNVALVTNHGEIIDIALVLAALCLAMTGDHDGFGVLGERVEVDQLAPHLNVLVSRMVTTRQAFNVPAVQVLQSLGRSWFSVPQTASRRRARLDPDLVRANNFLMRHELREVLGGGGQLLAMAASGSQDLSLAANLVQRVRAAWAARRGGAPRGPSLHLQPLYDGTIQLMLSCTDVVPIAISLQPEHPACVVGGVTRVREPDDCHRVMEWIAASHEEATGVATIYHRSEDDLLHQVRAALASRRSG